MLALMLFAWPGGVSAAGTTIDTITVSVTTVDGAQAPPARIAKRMAASVTTVGEHVLLGRKVSEIAAGQDSYERIIKEVFDRILVGYSVEHVRINPDVNTGIILELVPWGEVVREVVLEVDYGSVSPELAALIKADMGDVEERVNNILVGLPIDAVDWAGGVSKTVIQEVLAEQLPEFRSNFDVEAGARTVVKLSLVPTGETIKDVHVSLRSQSIPNVMLLRMETVFAEGAKQLTGLPVAFVERHRDYFAQKFGEVASRQYLSRSFGLTITPVISPGPDTVIVATVETDKYNIWLEGYLDMGRHVNDNTSARLHAGKFVGSRDEAFLEVEFIPNTVTWEFAPGWSHRFGDSTFIGVKHILPDNDNILTLNQKLSRDWSLRAERWPENNKNEFGLRYRLHDYLSAEYIFTEDESWLRLIGHL